MGSKPPRTKCGDRDPDQHDSRDSERPASEFELELTSMVEGIGKTIIVLCYAAWLGVGLLVLIAWLLS